MKIKMLKMAVMVMVLFCLLGSGCGRGQDEKMGLTINSMQSGIGSVNDNNDQQRFHYSLTLLNDSDQVVYVTSFEPILGDEITSRVMSQNYQAVDKKIYAGKVMQLKGEFVFDAAGLSKEEIGAMDMITGFQVSTQQILAPPGK